MSVLRMVFLGRLPVHIATGSQSILYEAMVQLTVEIKEQKEMFGRIFSVKIETKLQEVELYTFRKPSKNMFHTL